MNLTTSHLTWVCFFLYNYIKKFNQSYSINSSHYVGSHYADGTNI